MRSDNIQDDDLKDFRILSRLSRKSSGKVPEGYFDEFPERLNQKIRSMEAREYGPGPLSWRYWVPAAAVVLIAVGLGWMRFTADTAEPKPLTAEAVFNQLTAKDVMAHLYAQGVEEEIIVVSMGREALAAVEENTRIFLDSLESEITKEVILENNDLDLSEFYE